jgi:transcriptional regulator with XRE-family HTH domain
MKLDIVFGTILRDRRLELNLSQVQLGQRAKLDRTFISLVERGIRQPTLRSLFKLAFALGLEPSELLHLVEKNLRRSRWERLKF